MNREEAESVLDLFLFEDIENNYNHNYETHSITWCGNHFAVLEHSTGQVMTFKLEYAQSDLPVEKWKKIMEDQEWEDKIDRP